MAIIERLKTPKLYCKINGSDEYKIIGEVGKIETNVSPECMPTFEINLHGTASYIGIDNAKEFLMSLSKEKIQVELPEHYIINDGATILFWKDGTKTIVKRASDDEFNPRLAFLTAFFQRYCGMSKNKANKYLASLQVEVKKENSKSCKSKELRVGDKVFVKKNLKNNTAYGADVFVDSMNYLKGKEVTIRKVLDDGCYRIEEATYNWTKEMFDLRTIKHKEEK